MTTPITQDASYGVIPVSPAPDGRPKILVVQHLAGHWGFPKGHPEAGETPRQTAARELTEETGLVADLSAAEQPLIQTYDFTIKSGRVHKTVTYFVGRVMSRDVRVQAEEIADYRWVSAGEARKLFPPNSDALIDALEQRIAA